MKASEALYYMVHIQQLRSIIQWFVQCTREVCTMDH